MMKPVILITLHRRYEDLIKNLERINEKIHEFAEPPDIGIIWSTPEKDMEWLIDELYNKYERIKFIIYRPKLLREGEAGGTTYPESHNIVYGLRFIRDYYGEDKAYAIVQATDAYPLREAYGEIDRTIHADIPAVLYYWYHNCLSVPGFSTYFFAIRLNEKYWPPLSDCNNSDALEWQWAKIIYGMIKVENREPFGYEAFPPNRRFGVENLPTGTIYRRNNEGVNLVISGKHENIIYKCFSRWYGIFTRCCGICKSFIRSWY